MIEFKGKAGFIKVYFNKTCLCTLGLSGNLYPAVRYFLGVSSVKSHYDYNFYFYNIDDRMFDGIIITIEWNIFF